MAADSTDRRTQDLLDEIADGRPASVYLLHGDEDFLVDCARDAIVKALLAEGGGETESVDARETALARVLDSLAEVSLFSTRRIVVVRQAQSLGRGSEPEVEALERFCESYTTGANLLVLSAGGAFDRRTRLYRKVASLGEILSFDRLKGRALLRWVVEAAARRGMSIPREALDALVARAGSSLRQIDRELEKLSLWISPGKEIKTEDVEAVVPRSKEDVIFDLTGALGEREVGAGLRFLRELRFRGATPLMILSMLGREVRFLLQAKLLGGVLQRSGWHERMGFDEFCRSVWPKVKEEAPPARGNPRYHLFGANPYVAFLVFRRARQFSQGELQRGLLLIGRSDLALKSTTQSPDALLEKLVIELALPSRGSWAGTTS